MNKPLKTRKGICENFAMPYTSLCNRTGILSVVVVGYTKQKGFVDSYRNDQFKPARPDAEIRQMKMMFYK